MPTCATISLFTAFIEDMLAAAALLRSMRGPTCGETIMGNGHLAAMVRREIARKVLGSVSFLGFVPRPFEVLRRKMETTLRFLERVTRLRYSGEL